MKTIPYCLLLLTAGLAAAPANAIVINEIRVDQVGTDTDEYFELSGTPGQSLAGLTYIVVGDGIPATNTGVIESVLSLSDMVIQPDGYLAVHRASTVGTCGGYDIDGTLNFENSDNVTHLLVNGFSGTNGQDLDTNDDGILDVIPWTRIVDCVALQGPNRTPTVGADSVYCTTIVGPVGGFVAAHVLRCPDTTGDWAAGSFSVVCTYDSPGASNNCGNLPPVITNVIHIPCAPTASQQVTVAADVTDYNNNVTTVRVYYRLEAVVAWDSVAATPADPPTWEATLPVQVDQSHVLFYVGARDGTGNFVKAPTSAPAGFTYDYRVGIQTIEFTQTTYPHTLNLGSHGNWVTCYLEPPMGYDPADIDLSSVLLNGTVPIAMGAPTHVGDWDMDGKPDLMVKFDRAEVAAPLSVGNAVPMTICGLIDGECFQGMDLIKVKAAKLSSPVAGSVLVAGTQAEVRWEVENRYRSVDLLSSFNDGATWNVAARNLPNTGSALWIVPVMATERALLEVVVIEAENTGLTLAAEIGSSDAFAISVPTDVGNRHFVFALHGVVPNPARNGFTVNFSLSTADAAMLEVYDVRGRQVAAQQVGQLGAGLHSVTFGANRNFAAGVYMVRLSQNGRNLATHATVVQ